MSRAFTIRTATEADVEQITAIYGYHVLHGTGSFELEAPTVEEMKRRFHHIAERHAPYIVAVREDKPSVVLGYAYAGPFRERKGLRHHGRGFHLCGTGRTGPRSRIRASR